MKVLILSFSANRVNEDSFISNKIGLTFDGKLIQGNGILAELFIENGIEVINSEDY